MNEQGQSQSKIETGIAWTVLFIGVSAAVTTVIAAYLYFLELPIFDYWDVIYGSAQLENKGFSEHLAFYWAPFVDQKMVFPKLLIERLFHWTGNTHLALEILIGLLCQAFIAALGWKLGPPSESIHESRIRLGVILGLFFWPYLAFRFQHHWYSTQYSLAIAPGLLGIYLLRKYPGRWSALAGAFCLGCIGALSHGTGLFLLAAWLFVMPFQTQWTRLQRGLFCLGNVVLIGVVLATKPSQDVSQLPPLFDSLKNPGQFALFFFRCFGPRIHKGIPGIVLFLLSMLSIGKLIRGGQFFRSELSALQTLTLWCCAVAAGSSLARASLGAYPSHVYYAFFVLFAFVTFQWVVHTRLIEFQGSIARRGLSASILIYLLVVYGTGVEKGLRHVRVQRKKMNQLKRALSFGALTEAEDLALIFPHPRIRSQTLPLLYEKGYLPKGVNFEPLHKTRELGIYSAKNGDSVLIEWGRALKEHEVILIEIEPMLTPTVFWRDGADWRGDRWAPLVKFRGRRLWIRPSTRFAPDQQALKLGVSGAKTKSTTLNASLWARPSRVD